ncbi:co-chaperone DjlA [Endozoicomonas sp. SM1973]|uniref:Co-chaperone DjlA n=1 Tax=Spartinivicinus marinus TaxID=2994442 RepID=A0A853IGS1_9GAMM|nr:co-chaperone DjlA [Spartinivicinus marinus]MCX4028029.1 co-chaperone DjlA [Spartinivicinus marinus]NYZ68345.1 co-chaperone DjlA [Spartinivicinus marinus]
MFRWVGLLIALLIGWRYGGWLGALMLSGLVWAFSRQTRWQVLQGGKQDGSPKASTDYQNNAQQVQTAFFKATFLVMGKLAKADGRVSEQEIQQAASVMANMRLSQEQRKAAIALFNQGKQGNNQTVQQALTDFASQLKGNQSLLDMFIELQLQAAYADGRITQSEWRVLEDAAAVLKIGPLKLKLIHQRFLAQQQFYQRRNKTSLGKQVDNAYAVMGVSPSADDKTLKRAYRRLMSQHHPDKLLAKGLPGEMVQLAKEKTQEIQIAYELIKSHRKTINS